MATDAEKVKMYREKAKDTSIPQEVRNTYLDRANELERKAYEDSKGAPVTPEKKMMGGGYAMPTQPPMMAKGGAVKKPMAKDASAKYMEFSNKGKPKGMTPVKMNMGGYANCGASMAPSQKGKK